MYHSGYMRSMHKPKSRCDGWTPARRDSFIAALTAGNGVTRAAAVAGPSASSAYRLYRRDAAFKARWDGVYAARDAALRAKPLPSRAADAPDWQLIRWMDAAQRRGLRL